MIKKYTKRTRGWAAWPWYYIPVRIKGTLQEDAYVAHEETHCKQQRGVFPFSTIAWWVRWLCSKDFRWNVESKAYEAEILTLLRAGVWVDRSYFATEMAEGYLGMITYSAATKFVRAVIAAEEARRT